MSWWAYCVNADLEHCEGQFDTSAEASEHARYVDVGEFWVAECEEDPDGADDDAVRLLSEPVKFSESP